MERKANGEMKRWRNGFVRASFCFFLFLKRLCCPRFVTPEHPALFHLTKEQRFILSHTGMVDARRESVKAMANTRRLRLMDSIVGSDTVLAVDNYNKLRYTTNPAIDKNKTINAASLVILRLLSPATPRVFNGYPSMRTLIDNVPSRALEMCSSATAFERDVNAVLDAKYLYPEIRCPLDMRQKDVQTVQWQPFEIADIDTK